MPFAVGSSLLAVGIVSAASLVGALVLTLKSTLLSRIMLSLVSFSTGAILGTVFLHLLPESMEHANDPRIVSALILGGMILAFAVEKFIHWHHCHSSEHDDAAGHHLHPVGPLILIGDGLHNMLDGMLIAASFLVSVPVGIASTVAVLLHEIPQELSDVALLIHSGFSRRSAIVWNLLSACMAFVGAGITFLFQSGSENVEFFLLPIAAGNFLYIATTDLIPELHRETRASKTILQVLLIAVGIVLIGGLALLGGHA